MSRIDEAMKLLRRGAGRNRLRRHYVTVALTGQLARGHLFRGQADEGLARSIEPSRWPSGRDAPNPSLQLIITKSWALRWLGRFREARRAADRRQAAGRRRGRAVAARRSRFNLSSFSVIEEPHRGVADRPRGDRHQPAVRHRATPRWPAMEPSNAFIIGDFDEVLRLEQSIAPRSKSALHMASVHAYGRGRRCDARPDDEGARGAMALFEEQTVGSTSAPGPGQRADSIEAGWRWPAASSTRRVGWRSRPRAQAGGLEAMQSAVMAAQSICWR